MANSSMPDWLTADKLLWRPTTVEYPLAWDDVLVFKGNSWLDTYEEGGFNLVRKNTDLLVPIVKRTMGRKGFDKLREVESKRGWDGVTQWIGDVYRAAAYGHLAHFRSLAAAERDRPRNINSVFKRVFEMDKAEKGQLIDLWHESLNWEFSNWHHPLRKPSMRRRRGSMVLRNELSERVTNGQILIDEYTMRKQRWRGCVNRGLATPRMISRRSVESVMSI